MATKTNADRMTEATTTLSTLVNERIALKSELDALTDRLKALDEVVIEQFRNEGVTKVQTEQGKLNLIQSSTLVWNEELLKEILTPSQWRKVTVQKVDKARMEAQLVVGGIDEEAVSVAKSFKESRPFLR